ncbi:hypothetical protein MOQ_004165, partial [Trypanosoma cruzi marinkellei]
WITLILLRKECLTSHLIGPRVNASRLMPFLWTSLISQPSTKRPWDLLPLQGNITSIIWIRFPLRRSVYQVLVLF